MLWREIRPVTTVAAVTTGRLSPMVVVSDAKPWRETGMDKEEEMDASLDEVLRRSPFLTESLFDAIEGAIAPLTALIELLVAKDLITIEEITSVLNREANGFSDHHPAALNRWAVEFVAQIVEKAGRDGSELCRAELSRRRPRE